MNSTTHHSHHRYDSSSDGLDDFSRHGDDYAQRPSRPQHVDLTVLGDRLSRLNGLDEDRHSDMFTVAQEIGSGEQGMAVAFLTMFARVLQVGQTLEVLVDAQRETDKKVSKVLEWVEEKDCELNQNARAVVTNATKAAVWDPATFNYANSNLVNIATKDIRDNYSTNKMKTTLENKGALAKTLNSFLGTQSSYAKTICRSALIKTKDEPATTAASTIMKKMVGRTNYTRLELMNVVVWRSICRKHSQLMLPSKKRGATGESLDHNANNEQAQQKAASLFNAITEEFSALVKSTGSNSLRSDGWSQLLGQFAASERVLFPDEPLAELPTVVVEPAGRPVVPLPQRASSHTPLSRRAATTPANSSPATASQRLPSLASLTAHERRASSPTRQPLRPANRSMEAPRGYSYDPPQSMYGRAAENSNLYAGGAPSSGSYNDGHSSFTPLR